MHMDVCMDPGCLRLSQFNFVTKKIGVFIRDAWIPMETLNRTALIGVASQNAF